MNAIFASVKKKNNSDVNVNVHILFFKNEIPEKVTGLSFKITFLPFKYFVIIYIVKAELRIMANANSNIVKRFISPEIPLLND
jgi:hypothetical protein